MHWTEYRDAYQSYELLLSQSRVLTIVAREALKDFPARLPKAIRKPLTETMRHVNETLGWVKPATEGQPVPKLIEMDVTEAHEIAKAALSMYLARAYLGMPTQDLDFERALCSQALVMLFAHLDAFMCDSLETICRVCPAVMKSGNKKMDWDSILSYGGWEELLDHMVEEHLFEFGWQSVSQRVKSLRDRIGLRIDCQNEELASIEEAENVRHIVVHNGGRVSEEYLKRTGRTDVALGEPVPITAAFVDQALQSTRTLAGQLFLAVSEKFFGKDRSPLPGVWRTRRIGR